MEKQDEQGFNYADSNIKEMTDFFETRVENIEPKEEKKKKIFSSCQEIQKEKQKQKQTKRPSNVVESSEEYSVVPWPNKKYYIVHG